MDETCFQTTQVHWRGMGTPLPEPQQPSAGEGHEWQLRASSALEVNGGARFFFFWELQEVG